MGRIRAVKNNGQETKKGSEKMSDKQHNDAYGCKCKPGRYVDPNCGFYKPRPKVKVSKKKYEPIPLNWMRRK